MKSTKDNKKKNPHFSKEDANRKSSFLFTQLGLVLALLLAYVAIESKTLVDNSIAKYIPKTHEIEAMIPDTTPEEPKPNKPLTKSIPDPILENIQVKNNNTKFIETVIGTTDPGFNKPLIFTIDSIPEAYIPEEVTEDFRDIKDAPLFPGCKGSVEEKKQCFSDSVKKLVARKFNGDIVQEVGLSPGRKRIAVEFVVDKEGNIADVKVRAPHKRLEKETRRVINLLPQMSPGKQRGRAVGVRFMLPITFIVE